jgi:hypothetical protein
MGGTMEERPLSETSRPRSSNLRKYHIDAMAFFGVWVLSDVAKFHWDHSGGSIRHTGCTIYVLPAPASSIVAPTIRMAPREVAARGLGRTGPESPRCLPALLYGPTLLYRPQFCCTGSTGMGTLSFCLASSYASQQGALSACLCRRPQLSDCHLSLHTACLQLQFWRFSSFLSQFRHCYWS